MVIRFVVGVSFVYCDIVATKAESLSLSPKRSLSANWQRKGKKNAIAFKSKQDNVSSELVKKNEPEDLSHRKKKAKQVKVTSKRVFSGVGGFSTGSASSIIAIQVFDHVYCVIFFMLILIFI